MVSVLVADRVQLFADSLTRCLRGFHDLTVVEPYALTGLHAVETAIASKPDVVLIDYWIPGMSGPAAARAILKELTGSKVLFLAGFYVGPCQREEAEACGAEGFLRKRLPFSELVESIWAVGPRVFARSTGQEGELESSGPAVIPSGSDSRRRDRAAQERLERLLTLTPREIEILQQLPQGLAAKDLARLLCISAGTLKNHIHRMMVKTHALTQLELITMARQEGIIS